SNGCATISPDASAAAVSRSNAARCSTRPTGRRAKAPVLATSSATAPPKRDGFTAKSAKNAKNAKILMGRIADSAKPTKTILGVPSDRSRSGVLGGSRPLPLAGHLFAGDPGAVEAVGDSLREWHSCDRCGGHVLRVDDDELAGAAVTVVDVEHHPAVVLGRATCPRHEDAFAAVAVRAVDVRLALPGEEVVLDDRVCLGHAGGSAKAGRVAIPRLTPDERIVDAREVR